MLDSVESPVTSTHEVTELFCTRYGGPRGGDGLRGNRVVAKVAALHAAEFDITVMLQVGVGKPSKKGREGAF